MPSDHGLPPPPPPPPQPPEQPPAPQPPDRPQRDPSPQGPPPLPPLPEAPRVEPRRTGDEWPGPPPPSPSRRMGTAPAVFFGVIAVSLIANMVLASRVAETNRRLDEQRQRSATLSSEVERLRKQLAGGQQGSSPIDAVMEAVTRIRGLKFEGKVDAEILSDDALRKRILDEIQKADERAQIVATDKVLTTLGLLKPDDDLYGILVRVQTEQIGGFYDSTARKLVVAGSAASPKPVDRFLLSHELTHAVTDQRFDLSRIDTLQEERKDDEATAFLALAEGDATIVMDLYFTDYLTEDEQKDVSSGLGSAPDSEFRKAPAVVRQSLLFPYEAGRTFVEALLRRGGGVSTFDLVNKAYQDPPTSTEQIMHPAKYLAARRDEPAAVTLPDVAAAMGEGWKQIDAGGVGEFDIRLILDEFLDRADASNAGAGWDGGRYVAVESGAGTLVAMSTVWDSVTEAREAGNSFESWIQERFGGRGEQYRIDGGRGWEAPTGAAAVVRQEDKLFVIVGPDKASVEKARAAAGASGTAA